MKSEYNRLQTQINHLQSELDKLPDGKLICSKNQNRWKWFQGDGQHKTYIPKQNRPLAEKLLTEPSEYQKLLIPYFTPLSQELSEWMHSSYEQNPSYPEQRIHKSISGNLLRSKSEAMIDMLLFINKISFRYESILQLGDVTLYPDFTIRHPKTGVIYYWEHFGIMDNPIYATNAFTKLQLYTAHKIIPSIQLITTYETKDHPLTMDVVERLIKEYFAMGPI